MGKTIINIECDKYIFFLEFCQVFIYRLFVHNINKRIPLIRTWLCISISKIIYFMYIIKSIMIGLFYRKL